MGSGTNLCSARQPDRDACVDPNADACLQVGRSGWKGGHRGGMHGRNPFCCTMSRATASSSD